MLDAFDSTAKTRLLFFIIIAILTVLIVTVLTTMNYLVAIGIAVFLILLFILFTNTNWTIYILILSMLLSPEYGTRGTMGEGVTFRMDDILLLLVLFVWLARIAVFKDLRLLTRTVISRPIVMYSLICVLSTGLGMIFGRVRPMSGFFFTLKIIQYFMIFQMVTNYLTIQVGMKKQAKNYIVTMIITFTIVTLMAIAQIPSGERLTAPFEGDAGEPNTLGGYLVLMISLNLGLILTKGAMTNRWIRRGVITITLVSILPFLLTNSRGSWLSFIPVVIMFILLGRDRRAGSRRLDPGR